MCHFLIFLRALRISMASLGQKHGGCGHLMAGFNTHSFCARCRNKGKGPDSCISKGDCLVCNVLKEDQCVQLSTPSYRLEKEKREQKTPGDTPQYSDSSSLTDPSSVTVVGAVDDQGMLQSPGSSFSSDKKNKRNPRINPKLINLQRSPANQLIPSPPDPQLMPGSMSWIKSYQTALTDLKHCFSPELLINQSPLSKLLK